MEDTFVDYEVYVQASNSASEVWSTIDELILFLPKSPPTLDTEISFNANVTKEVRKTKKIIKPIIIQEPKEEIIIVEQ